MSLPLRLPDEPSNELGLPATASRQFDHDLYTHGLWLCRLNANLEPVPLTLSYDNHVCVGAVGNVT